MKGLQGTVGRYQVLGHWASGRSSEVYAVRGEVPGGAVGTYALKVMAVGDVAGSFRDQLLLRIRAFANFEHPQVARMHDAFVHQGHLAVVSDFIAGETLEHVLKSEGAPLSASLAMAIAMEIANAAHECHQQRDHLGVPWVHGDICPAHVMLTHEGDVVLLDPGLSLLEARVRRDGKAHGHFAYFAPERASRAADVDHLADVYSIGLILWEMLTGIPAIQGSSDAELLQHARRGQIPPPSSRIRIGASLDGVVEQALAHYANQRFLSARDLAGAMSEILFNRRPSWSTRVEVEKVMQRRFAHKARATRTLLKRWSGGEASAVRGSSESSASSVLDGPTLSSAPSTAARTPAPRPRMRSVSSEARLLAAPALDTLFHARTDDLSGRATGDLRPPEDRRKTVLWGILFILVGAFSAICVTLVLPAEWRSTADGSGGTIGGSVAAFLGSVVRWIMERIP